MAAYPEPFEYHEHPDLAVAEKIQSLESMTFVQARDCIRHWCRTDYWFLVRYIFGYHFFCEDLHYRTLYKWKLDNWESDLVTCIPRGHVKTLSTAVEITQDILRDPDIAILAVSATDDLTKGLGAIVGDTLRHNPKLVTAFPDICPQPDDRLTAWGAHAYQLPNRKKRLEHTLEVGSLRKTKTGKHPDKVYIDDITEQETNNELGWKKGVALVHNLRRMCNPWGVFRWNATRWDDSDPVGQAIDGELLGRQGPFESLVMSCYVDDHPAKGVIYERKKRWTEADKPDEEAEWSGYTKEEFERERRHPNPVVRRFFSCQLRNNPIPEEEQRLELKSLHFYGPTKKVKQPPETGRVLSFGIEITGGGLVIYNLLEEHIREQRLNIPIEQVTYPKERGVEKCDRIQAALDPWIRDGRLWVPEKEFPDDKTNRDCLGYELRRLGAARHDDIADALHIIPQFLINGKIPIREKDPADLYLSADLAYSESKQSDYTVLLAGCVDHKNQFWLLGYDRFREKRPTVIIHRIVSFFNYWNNKQKPMPQGQSWSWANSYN